MDLRLAWMGLIAKVTEEGLLVETLRWGHHPRHRSPPFPCCRAHAPCHCHPARPRPSIFRIPSEPCLRWTPPFAPRARPARLGSRAPQDQSPLRRPWARLSAFAGAPRSPLRGQALAPEGGAPLRPQGSPTSFCPRPHAPSPRPPKGASANLRAWRRPRRHALRRRTYPPRPGSSLRVPRKNRNQRRRLGSSLPWVTPSFRWVHFQRP